MNLTYCAVKNGYLLGFETRFRSLEDCVKSTSATELMVTVFVEEDDFSYTSIGIMQI